MKRVIFAKSTMNTGKLIGCTEKMPKYASVNVKDGGGDEVREQDKKKRQS